MRTSGVWPAAVVVTAILAGCGGSGGGSASSAAVDSTVAGAVVKGPVAGATVTAYAIESGAIGRQLGTGSTDGAGNFSMSLGAYAGPVMLRSAGGHYTNEATGTDMPMQAGDVMAVMLPSVSPAAPQSGVQVTPLTSMAQSMAQRMPGGMTVDNMATAHAGVGNYFMVTDIVHGSPMNPLTPGAGSNTTADGRNYGMAIAAMSQLALSLGMPFSSGMATAMASDAADGCMDGKSAGANVMMGGGMMAGTSMPSFAGTSGLANAMTDFARSAMNRSGVSQQDMQALINRLMASNCSLR